ncbi:ArsR/SmtB family transcription factor [Paractinoplanes lichenicola]|uniref:Winged helix-turn-helix transcriptional regulator n=1 Tax=Paractinoplanes lichenicola TaxID=2802976 RepID=A0ABS1VX03_9ACTN|nr:metalloregulator ArsR/SmtB family transcription factor [Actinoplanes lichenicola]MBL7258984.1 winged helix-turn-helix transcriptional regulator [Actinoplanes lichenicola]
MVVDADRVFQALADATRRDILARVLHEGHSVSSLARLYPMSFAAVQKHVAVLEAAGLVSKERRGREQVVHGEAAVLRQAGDVLTSLWQHRVRGIEDVLKGDGNASS